MKIFDTIKRNIVTEKSQRLELSWAYTVEVNSRATKVDIRDAFKELYKVNVEGVNIIKIREKFKKAKKWVAIKKKNITKAIVRLKKWEKITDFIKLKMKDKD